MQAQAFGTYFAHPDAPCAAQKPMTPQQQVYMQQHKRMQQHQAQQQQREQQYHGRAQQRGGRPGQQSDPFLRKLQGAEIRDTRQQVAPSVSAGYTPPITIDNWEQRSKVKHSPHLTHLTQLTHPFRLAFGTIGE